ncbi:FecR family protein [Dyadobacter sp. CY107]|uniref:FecR family protein n=1 Tax=Dyadobacter fanqingshengii TaxID=2906443 RepID=UPI001F1F3273|nr:FecR family protein [Dyadobacter fanqingshengii]MCF2502111.1 FecR family protein [Dyadobacter fanqingshengii]
MDQDKIKDLLERYRSRQCSAQEIQQVNLWYEGIKRQSEHEFGDQERLLTENRIFAAIEKDIAGDMVFAAQKPKDTIWRYWAAGIAASLLLALGLAFYFNQTTLVTRTAELLKNNFDKETDQVRFENTTSIEKRIKLDDGSIVTLSPGGQIMYPKQFAINQRVVNLSGDAFFEITKNPKRPFFVYSGKLVAQVLGTSFWVKSNKETDALLVEVVTGKVSVFENIGTRSAVENETGKERVVLTPNQRVTYFTENGRLLAGLVEKPKALALEGAPVEQSFDHTPLPEIISGFYKKYGVEIVLAHEELEKCTFTGDVTGLALYDALELICGSISGSYQINGTRILITGNGCN